MNKDTIFIIILVFVVVILGLIAHVLDQNRNIDRKNLNRTLGQPQGNYLPFLLELYPSLIEYVANKIVFEKNARQTISFRYNTRAIVNKLVSAASQTEAQNVSEFLKNYRGRFEDRLRNKQLVDNRGQLLTNNRELIANEFYVFYKENHRDNKPNLRAKEYVTKVSQTVLSDGISPTEFFDLRKNIQGDVVGVYILLNINKCKHYVGQAKRVYFRINQHFTGKGNLDIYSDYMYGNNFRIKIIRLSDSGYYDLDKLEKDMIAKYDAYRSGYNKTIGNGL